MASSAPSSRRAAFLVACLLLAVPGLAQPADPDKLLAEADRLGWMKLWARAEPLFVEAQKLFEARGEQAKALHAKVGSLRAQLPRLPAPDVSQELAALLDDALVREDDRLRLRVLLVKGETDEDLDPAAAQESWQEAQKIAERLGDAASANRARGELGIVAALLGNVSASIIHLGSALKVAQATNDVPSLVRWLTLSGRGFAEMGRTADALGFYDRALAAASTMEELSFPVMTHLAKGDALAKLGRTAEAEATLRKALEVATQLGGLSYEAELSLKLAVLASTRKSPDEARRWLEDARGAAARAGTNRVAAQVALEGGRLLREQGRLPDAASLLNEGVVVARRMQERMALPRLLAELAEVRTAERNFEAAASLLEEASDLLEGLLSKTSSPWVQGRIINGAKDILLARVRLEGMRGPDAARLFGVVEQARGRALLELLRARPVASVAKPAALSAQEQEIAKLQQQLFRPMSRAERRQLLARISVAEEALAPLATQVFDQTRQPTAARETTLASFQQALRPNELFLAFALAEPDSFAIAVTRQSASVAKIAGRAALRRSIESLLEAVRNGRDAAPEARLLGAALLGTIKELPSHPVLIVSPDAELHHVPFELLATNTGSLLLDTHAVSYAPSASVLLRVRSTRRAAPTRSALAVSASPKEPAVPSSTSGVVRSVFDLDGAQLRPLPSANDEARAVAAALGDTSTLLLGDAATESAIKQLPLQQYRVVHFAVHGVPSSKFPAQAALLVRPGGDDDGLLQAREILELRFAADLVTLSACETGSGSLQEQEGVASLVRPFLAAGARAVVANLWTVEDEFSLTMMREFYKQLASGVPVGEALRRSKRHMVGMFGPKAIPRLWSGVLVYGDASVRVVDVRAQ